MGCALRLNSSMWPRCGGGAWNEIWNTGTEWAYYIMDSWSVITCTSHWGSTDQVELTYHVLLIIHIKGLQFSIRIGPSQSSYEMIRYEFASVYGIGCIYYLETTCNCLIILAPTLYTKVCFVLNHVTDGQHTEEMPDMLTVLRTNCTCHCICMTFECNPCHKQAKW